MNKSNEVIDGSDQKSENHAVHSCCCGSENQKNDVGSVNSNTLYQCPMKCEGNKTYKVPGICPVCNMHLKPIN